MKIITKRSMGGIQSQVGKSGGGVEGAEELGDTGFAGGSLEQKKNGFRAKPAKRRLSKTKS